VPLPLCFLDANVLAKPFTRTLLLTASAVPDATFTPVWSQRAEDEATRALERRFAGRATGLAALRAEWGFELTSTGRVGERFAATSASDRQILADAAEAGAFVLVTEDVDDFATVDLDTVGVTAMHYDLFAAHWLTATGYRAARDPISRGISAEQVHAAVARVHPRLFAAFADEFPDIDPEPRAGQPPREIIRGTAWQPGRSR
jgi:hypothetical protein